ncbi:MAG: NAD-dependent epimerase/dehydratase family protein [Acidobacteriales bacterium]|nr:NAD-dependent epimerase/dehydratase family protein [Terriglobales bacterium]
MAENSERTVLVTGVSGDLGSRLVSQLNDFRVVGVDIGQPRSPLFGFHAIDLGTDDAARRLEGVLRETQPSAVVHLAFVLDPLRTGILDRTRMWQINVAGTRRLLDAITEVNASGGKVRKFVFASSVSAYGPNLPHPVREDHALGGHTLVYAAHKRESDELVQSRWQQLGACSTYILRPHIFTGPTVQNYQIGALRGTPGGKSKLAARMRNQGKRLPIVVPLARKYLENKFQFVHVDDVARLIAFILRRADSAVDLTILNVAGREEPLPLWQCAEICDAKIMRLPTKLLCRLVIQAVWSLGISSIPPDAFPYLIGSYTMDTSRLRAFLGDQQARVIRHTVREALEAAFEGPSAQEETKAMAG